MDYELKEYGILKDAVITEKYNDDIIESFKVEEESKLNINGQIFIPRYGMAEERRKELPAIRLYKSGKIKSLDLEEITEVKTKAGTFKAEKIVFYEDGNIKRIFPLDGKMSGYWSEEDEYNLAEEYEFKFSFTEFKKKIISIQFMKNGDIKSVTLWPKERINVIHNNEKINVRVGFSIYEDGTLKTCEPSSATVVNTPIGKIEAYDENAIGIHGEDNSLKFNKDGTVKELITSTNIIKVINKDGDIIVHSPREVYLFANSDMKDLITVSLEFTFDKVIIDKIYEYDLSENKFKIETFGEKKLTLIGDII